MSAEGFTCSATEIEFGGACMKLIIQRGDDVPREPEVVLLLARNGDRVELMANGYILLSINSDGTTHIVQNGFRYAGLTEPRVEE